MVFQGSSLFFSCFHVVFLYSFFQGSRFVFHDFWWVLRVNDGSRSVFIVPSRFFMVSGGFFIGFRSVCLVFSRFQVGFSFFYGSSSGFPDLSIVPGWFKSGLSAGGAE